MIRTLIVDDEKLARDRLQTFLKGVKDVQVVGEATNGLEAVQLIEEEDPDLVFLDVQMPGMDGFGVLKAISKRPQIVFATAHDEYAIQAFEVHAADYLLKPISRARLDETVRRVRTQMDGGNGSHADYHELLRALESRERRAITQLPVHKGRQILILPVSDILWFEVEYRLVYAHTGTDRYMTNFTLKELEDRLDMDMFFRAHKSRLVNLKQVKAIVPWFGGRFKLVMRNPGSSEVELSRAQARILRRRMRW